jgi:hypothetical protein
LKISIGTCLHQQREAFRRAVVTSQVQRRDPVVLKGEVEEGGEVINQEVVREMT